MKIVLVRLDLDTYSLESLEGLVINQVIKLSEAKQSAAYLRLDDYTRLVWERSMKSLMKDGVVAA